MQMLTPKDVAEQLKISVDTVKRLRNQGKFNFKKIGGQWRIAEDDLLLCIDKMQEPKEPVKCTRTCRTSCHVPLVPIKYVNGDRIMCKYKPYEAKYICVAGFAPLFYTLKVSISKLL